MSTERVGKRNGKTSVRKIKNGFWCINNNISSRNRCVRRIKSYAMMVWCWRLLWTMCVVTPDEDDDGDGFTTRYGMSSRLGRDPATQRSSSSSSFSSDGKWDVEELLFALSLCVCSAWEKKWRSRKWWKNWIYKDAITKLSLAISLVFASTHVQLSSSVTLFSGPCSRHDSRFVFCTFGFIHAECSQKWFRKGKRIKYGGQRQEHSIAHCMHQLFLCFCFMSWCDETTDISLSWMWDNSLMIGLDRNSISSFII